MAADLQRLNIAGTSVLIRHKTDLLRGEIDRMYGHFLAPVDSQASPPFTVEIRSSTSPAPVLEAPTIKMIADRLILGEFRGDTMELSDGRSHGVVDYARGRVSLTIHTPTFEALFVAVHRLFPIALGELLRLAGRYPVHGAAVETTNRQGYLLLGDSEAGKSTLVYQATRAGNRCVADDGVVICRAPAGFRAFPFYRDFNLDPRNLTPEHRAASVPSAPAPSHEKVAVNLDDDELAPSCLLNGVFIVSRTGDPTTSVQPCSPGEMIAALYRQYPWIGAYPPIAGAHLETLAQLTREVSCFIIYSGTDILQPGCVLPWDLIRYDG